MLRICSFGSNMHYYVPLDRNKRHLLLYHDEKWKSVFRVLSLKGIILFPKDRFSCFWPRWMRIERSYFLIAEFSLARTLGLGYKGFCDEKSVLRTALGVFSGLPFGSVQTEWRYIRRGGGPTRAVCWFQIWARSVAALQRYCQKTRLSQKIHFLWNIRTLMGCSKRTAGQIFVKHASKFLKTLLF